MRIKCFIILLTIIFPLFSQNSSSNEVDSLLKESHKKFAELKFIESSEIADKALDISTLNNYSKGMVMSKLYIAKVLLEIGLNMEALAYLDGIGEELYFRNEVIPQVESYRLKGRVYGNQQLYSLAKDEFIKQYLLSDKIQDPIKRELSKLWAYQNIEHLYSLQGLNDSIQVYQKLQEEHLTHFEEKDAFYNISALHSSRAKLYINSGEFEKAAVEVQKSIDMLEKYNIPYKYKNLMLLGNIEAAKGNVDKAISYYNDALENTFFLNATQTSRDLYKILADYMFKNDTLLDRAREYSRDFTILNDSLTNHNSMVVNTILENIIKDKDEASVQKSRIFGYILAALILLTILLGVFIIRRNSRNRRRLISKETQLSSKTEKIEELEEELENNIFQQIIELAKSNSPEFLLLFGKGYPEFVAAMKELDPNMRSTELYFCALAYLNFSTKDIANYTFVTVRAVQVRRNRLRKKYNIPSDIDFNEWFRRIENSDIHFNQEVDK